MLASLALALLQVADVPTAPPTGLEIVVRCSHGLGADAPLLEGIDFEVLRIGERSLPPREGWGGEPDHEIGARVCVGQTDANGEARVALPEDVALDEDGLPLVLVRVIEPGYQQRTQRPRPFRGSGPPTARIVPRAGATARGRVVDGEGRGVEAFVRYWRWIDRPEGRELLVLGSAQRRPDGRFELHYDRDLPGAVVTVEAEGHGSAARTDLELSLANPPQDLHFVARGDGVVRGVVVGGDGRGIASLPLFVCLAEIDGDGMQRREPQRTLRRIEGVGLTEVTLATDAEGRFEVRGLRGEPYVVRARVGSEQDHGYGDLLTPRPVPPDGVELRLMVREPQILVRLLDEDGAPWSGAAPVLNRGSIWDRERLGWNPAPLVGVHPASPAGSAPEVTGERLTLRSVSGHEAACSVEPGARYLVDVRGERFTAPPQVIDVPPGGGRVEVEVRASPAIAWGDIVVNLTTDGSGAKYRVTLEDPATGLCVCELDAPVGTVPKVRVPVGRYRVVVEGRTDTEYQHGTIMRLRRLGRAEAEVEVLAETTTEVPLEIRDGARLDLTLTGRATDADREALVREQPVLALENNAEALAMYQSSASIVLQRPHRGPETVYRVHVLEGSSAAGKHLWTAWPLGERHESVPVAAGTWTLVARMPGGREVATEVVLREGAVTPVRLAFGSGGR